MNILLRLSQQTYRQKSLLNTSFFTKSKLGGLFNTQVRTFSETQVFDFSSPRSGKPNRSESGIYLGKNNSWAFRKCFSMKSFRHKVKVNVQRKPFYSDILGKKFFVNVSTHALRTIRKYGSFDNFLLTSNSNHLDSKFALTIRRLLLQKLRKPSLSIPNLPNNQKPKNRRRKLPQEHRNIPSVYIPTDVKLTDMSEVYYNFEELTTRQELEADRLLKERIDNEPDAEVKDRLRQDLLSTKEMQKIKSEILSLQPLRHKVIRDVLVKIKDKGVAKYHFLKTIERSEEQSKLALKEDYQHFSENYPEVQLILEQTNKQMLRKQERAGAKKFSVSKYEMGNTYIKESTDYNPVKKKTGITPRIRMGVSVARKNKLEKRDKRIVKKLAKIIRHKKEEKLKRKKNKNSSSSKKVKSEK